MTKTILILVIAAAFVAGTITTTAIPMAEAADKSHQDIINAINNGVNNILNAVTGAKNEIKTDTAAIMAKTNALPYDPASNTAISNVQAAINSHTDSAIASISGGGTNCVTIDINRDDVIDYFEISPRANNFVNWSNCDLRGAQLIELNLRTADLRGVNLSYGKLTLSDLHFAFLNGAVLRFADLTEVDLQGARLNGADFTSANLDGAQFTGAFIDEETNFAGCTGTPVGFPSTGTLPTCS